MISLISIKEYQSLALNTQWCHILSMTYVMMLFIEASRELFPAHLKRHRDWSNIKYSLDTNWSLIIATM